MTEQTAATIEPMPANYYPNSVCECEYPCDAYGGCVNVPGTGHDPLPTKDEGEGAVALPDVIHIMVAGDHKEAVRVLLACGHYSQSIHERSSTFDFPEDGAYCPECLDSMDLHPRVIAELERCWALEDANQ